MSELRRSLTLYPLTMIAIGCSIGSGIFRTPGQIAAHVHLPEYVIALWILGGLVALTGALTYAEMGGMFPGAGGLYVYLREAYGDAMAFMYGWFILFISTAGAIAALVAVCAEHLLYLAGPEYIAVWKMPLAIFLLVFLTVVNLFGVQVGEWIANIFTGAKLLGLLLIIGAGIWWVQSHAVEANDTGAFANTPPANPTGAFALGFIGVLWSYGGWQHVSFMAGEAKNPQKVIPRAMLLGAGIVTLMYVLANLAYMRLLPVEQVAVSKTVAADALNTVGSWGGPLMAFLIALSTFGTVGIYCMTAPRMYYAMAKDGIFFKKLAEIHPRWRTPVYAILIQSSWALILLLFWGTFENLIEYVTFMDYLGLLMVATTIFVFRKKRPDAPRSYRTTGYPFTPAVFIAICAWFIVFTVWQTPVRAGAGILVALAGWGAYHFYFKKKS
jgi:APA family basic amino acid/polyamine antiporter